MSCYFVAQITIRDREEYRKYEDGFDEVFRHFGGTVISVDDRPELLEGSWRHTRFVLIRFSDTAEARRWYDSPEYRALLEHRIRAADTDVILVQGRD